MTDVFISYAREDRARIEKLAAALDAEGVAVWWDKNLSGGVDFSKETETRLTEAKAILVAWSKVSVSSMWVGDEAAVGREKGNLVPVAIDAVAPKIGFRGIHTVDLSQWKGDRAAPEFIDLARTLKTRISGVAPPAVTPTRRRMKPALLVALGASAVLLVGLGIFAARPLFAPSPTPAAATAPAAPVAESAAKDTASAASIAVLAFDDMSPAKDQEYFADGMAEEILNVLARVDGLKIASRTSSFAFKTQPNANIPTIARDLGVRHILEGSVRKAGDTVRITVQLIDTAKDAHLWSETFDRPLTTTNLFAIQDEVAGKVVAVLREKIGARVGDATAAPKRTDNVDAYALFLKARALFQARRDYKEADALLEQALRLDPKFADALAIRAAVRLTSPVDFGGGAEALPRGRAFAGEALALDPNSSLALAVIGFSDMADHNTRQGAPYATILATYDRALALDPMNSNALNWKGAALNYLGNNEEAVTTFRRCIEVEPANAACRSGLTNALLSLGRHKEAEAVLDATASAGLLIQTQQLLLTLAELRRKEAFRLTAQGIPILRGWRDFDALYEAIIEPGGDHRALAAKLKALLDENRAQPTAYGLLNALGDYERRPSTSYWFELSRRYRQSPQFKQQMRTDGVVEYWKARGFPPQCHAVGNDDFACD